MPLGKFFISMFRLLPPQLRERLKLVLGAGGHSKSFIDALRARQLGQSWKHPDHLFPVIRQIIETTDTKSLEGKRVMEYGSGFLMAEPLIYSMLGAKEVHAIDYLPLLQDDAFRAYAQDIDWNRYPEFRADGANSANAKARISRLGIALQSSNNKWFEQLGIRYVAPFDILANAPPAEGYDLIVSRSTLEHVPANIAQEIVTRLAALVKPGGTMYHYIHLADHRDIEHDPYAFLAADSDYLPSQHDIRGNRLRASEWQKIFASIEGFQWKQTGGSDDPALLPAHLAEPFKAFARDDLLINHFTIYGKRQ